MMRAGSMCLCASLVAVLVGQLGPRVRPPRLAARIITVRHGALDTDALGKWLGSINGTPTEGLKLDSRNAGGHKQGWYVEVVPPS